MRKRHPLEPQKLPNETEANFQAEAVKRGYTIWKRGWPDFILTHPTEPLMVVEVKSGGRLSYHQTVTMELLQGAGIRCGVWVGGNFQKFDLRQHGAVQRLNEIGKEKPVPSGGSELPGVPPKGQVSWDGLEGRFFHTFDEPDEHGIRYVKYQGQILQVFGDNPATAVMEVRYFEWFTGSAGGKELRRVSDAIDGRWRIYETDEEMRYEYEYMLPKRPMKTVEQLKAEYRNGANR